MQKHQAKSPQYFDEFQGLRGILALWVFFSHVYDLAPLTDLNLSPLIGIFIKGGQAVSVFIILSGFVITHTLATKRQSYWGYIVNRFFRLYPLFFICTLVYVIVMGYWQKPDLWKYVPSQLFMIHGVPFFGIPKNSPQAFLGPAWSISLEWQFYIVAPALLMLTQFKYRFLCLLGINLTSLTMLGWVPELNKLGFLLKHLHYFLIGIASYWIFVEPPKHFLQKDFAKKYYISALILILLLAMFLAGVYQEVVAVLICWALGCFATFDSENSVFWKPVKSFLLAPFIQWLGKLSFSIYLVHDIVLRGINKTFFITLTTELTLAQHFIFLLVVGFLITLGLSVLTYRFIETPGIRLGRKWIQAPTSSDLSTK